MTYPAAGPAFAHPVRQPRRGVGWDMLLGAMAGTAGVWAMDRVGWFLYNREDRAAMARELQARKGGGDVGRTGFEREGVASPHHRERR